MRSFFEALLGRNRRARTDSSYPPGHVPPKPMPAPAVPGLQRTPAAYVRATWYCTLPHDTEAGEIGFAVKPLDAELPQRYALSTQHAMHLLETLALNLGYELSKSAAGSQSPMSELMPSLPRSVPSEGDQQCPPAASSIA